MTSTRAVFGLWLTFSSLLACAAPAAPCPEARAPDDAVNTSGGDAPSGFAALTNMDGRWYLLEPDGTDVEGVLELSGNAGTGLGGSRNDRMEVRAERRPGGAWKVVLADPARPERRRIRVLMFPRGPHSALAIADSQETARIARREGPPPAYLEGRWELASPTGGRVPFTAVEVRGTSVQLEGTRDGASVGQVAGLMREGPTDDVVFTAVTAGRTERTWIRLTQLSDGALLMMAPGDEDYLVLHRPGERPTWMPVVEQTPVPPIDPPPPG